MKAALERYERESCSYKELCYLMRNIAELTHQPMPKVPVPTYSQAALVEVPSDDEIVKWVKAAQPSQRWYLGMMATYGLRPHEIEGSELIAEGRIQVPDTAKTGFRTVIPLHREWFDLFDLGNPKPRERTRPSRSRDSGDEVAQWLWNETKRNLGLPWRPYALRHAYAARLWRMGGSRLDLYTAARLMGHSVAQHEKTYRAHIQPHTIADDAERALAAHARILNGGIG